MLDFLDRLPTPDRNLSGTVDKFVSSLWETSSYSDLLEPETGPVQFALRCDVPLVRSVKEIEANEWFDGDLTAVQVSWLKEHGCLYLVERRLQLRAYLYYRDQKDLDAAWAVLCEVAEKKEAE